MKYFIYRLIHAVTALMLVIFIMWEAFASRWELSSVEVATTNPEWLHECPPPYPTFEESTYVHLKPEGKSSSSVTQQVKNLAFSFSFLYIKKFFLISLFFYIYYFFPLYSMGTKLYKHGYIIFSHIIMLWYKYLDIVLSAIQQDLIVNAFQEQ